jgi:hypothetical protein
MNIKNIENIKQGDLVYYILVNEKIIYNHIKKLNTPLKISNEEVLSFENDTIETKGKSYVLDSDCFKFPVTVVQEEGAPLGEGVLLGTSEEVVYDLINKIILSVLDIDQEG